MIDCKRNEIRIVIEPAVEKILRTLFFWTTSEKEFGEMLIYLHLSLMWFVIVVVVVLNLIRLPSLLTGILILVVCIILGQHYLLGVCILSCIEKRVNGAPYPMIEPVLKFLGMESTISNKRGITCLSLTLFLISIALQLIRQSVNWR